MAQWEVINPINPCYSKMPGNTQLWANRTNPEKAEEKSSSLQFSHSAQVSLHNYKPKCRCLSTRGAEAILLDNFCRCLTLPCIEVAFELHMHLSIIKK